MTRAARLLRFDRPTWARFDATTSVGSAAIIAVGAFAVLAWDRFGFQTIIAPRATSRLVLIGIYGWLGLAGLAWLLARWLVESPTQYSTVFRLYGLAHLPLVLVAVAAQVTGVLFDFVGPGKAVAAFAALVWMPGQMIAATRQAFGVDTARAAALIAVPYILWLGAIGLTVGRQVGHLL